MITLSRLRPGHGSLDESAHPILAFRLVVALWCRLDSPRIGPWAERGYRHWLLRVGNCRTRCRETGDWAEEPKDFVCCRANSGHLADVGWTAQFDPQRPLAANDADGP